jgi:predicted aminopeptidase
VSSFRGFERGPINNASIISRRIYYDRLELFEAVHENLGGDLPATIRVIQDAAEERRREPFAALAELATAAGE